MDEATFNRLAKRHLFGVLGCFTGSCTLTVSGFLLGGSSMSNALLGSFFRDVIGIVVAFAGLSALFFGVALYEWFRRYGQERSLCRLRELDSSYYSPVIGPLRMLLGFRTKD